MKRDRFIYNQLLNFVVNLSHNLSQSLPFRRVVQLLTFHVRLQTKLEEGVRERLISFFRLHSTGHLLFAYSRIQFTKQGCSCHYQRLYRRRGDGDDIQVRLLI